MKAIWNGEVIAESNQTIEIEGKHYFPREAIREKYFQQSPTQTVCPWKGIASYYTVEVNGLKNQDAAWSYLSPKEAAQKIKDRIAFWGGVEVVEE